MVMKHRAFKCCAFCSLCMLSLIYTFIYYGHNATCYIHPNLCQPWDAWLKKLRNPYNAMTKDEFNTVMHDMWTSNISESLSCKNSSFHNDAKNPHNVKFGILVAQRHGGSNWIISELYKYKISVHGELLLHWENHECSRFSQYMELTACNELSLINELDTIYLNYIDKHVTYHDEKKIKYMFWKIQIGQIPPYLFKTLIHYIYCHNIMVLHIVRQASVASFWSIQAQTVERIYTLNPDKFFKMNHHGLAQLDENERINALQLDPHMTLTVYTTLPFFGAKCGQLKIFIISAKRKFMTLKCRAQRQM
eukprot:455915_1